MKSWTSEKAKERIQTMGLRPEMFAHTVEGFLAQVAVCLEICGISTASVNNWLASQGFYSVDSRELVTAERGGEMAKAALAFCEDSTHD